MNIPKVSILVPVYNRREYIAECLQSALNQTFTDFEVVVVDNASTDGTWEICQQFARNDQRVRVFQNDANIGPVRNWLACVEKARGEFGKILFSDDLMFPRFLERTMVHFDCPDVGFVSTEALVGSTPENGAIMYRNEDDEQCLSSERYFELLLTACVPFSPGAAVFRMADIRENLRLSFPTCIPWDFTKNGAGPDVLLYALTARNYKSVVMLPFAEVFFRGHAGSFTTANSDEVATGYRAALAWFCKTHLSKGYWTKYIARAWLSNAVNTRRLTSLTEHCSTLEGDGGIIEAMTVLTAALRIVILELINKINRKSVKQ